MPTPAAATFCSGSQERRCHPTPLRGRAVRGRVRLADELQHPELPDHGAVAVHGQVRDLQRALLQPVLQEGTRARRAELRHGQLRLGDARRGRGRGEAAKTAGDQVAEWEIGNEGYGCWEDNNWLADAPEDYKGFNGRPRGGREQRNLPDGNEGSVNAGMKIMAKSYAANAGKFMAAMKAVNRKRRHRGAVRVRHHGGRRVGRWQHDMEQHRALGRPEEHRLRGPALVPGELRRHHRRRRKPHRPAGNPVRLPDP